MEAFKNQAACASTDTEMWFTGDDNPTVYENKDLLVRTCRSCEAKVECLDYALSVRVRGFWAGTTDKDRQKIRTRLNIIPRQVIEERRS
jgi:hypothetical protein